MQGCKNISSSQTVYLLNRAILDKGEHCPKCSDFYPFIRVKGIPYEKSEITLYEDKPAPDEWDNKYNYFSKEFDFTDDLCMKKQGIVSRDFLSRFDENSIRQEKESTIFLLPAWIKIRNREQPFLSYEVIESKVVCAVTPL